MVFKMYVHGYTQINLELIFEVIPGIADKEQAGVTDVEWLAGRHPQDSLALPLPTSAAKAPPSSDGKAGLTSHIQQKKN